MKIYIKSILFYLIVGTVITFFIWGIESITWRLVFQATFIGILNASIFTRNRREKLVELLKINANKVCKNHVP